MERLIHLLIPRESNNHKAKILQPSGLLGLALSLVVLQGILVFLEKKAPSILGFSAQISIEDIVNLTNAKRVAAGLPPLTLNQTLSSAAYTKGRDMIDKDYWAHTAPDGTTPWSFFNRFGYKYRYAGENLARDFTNAASVVEAWMNSPTHRDNILNPKYKEIGVGITEGDLAGSDTTIVVQFFGTASSAFPKVAQAVSTEEQDNVNKNINVKNNRQISKEASGQIPAPEVVQIASPLPVAVIENSVQEQKILISPFNTTKAISFGIVALLLLVLLIDSYLVSKRRITRIAGRSFAHFIFLLMLLSIVIIIRSGRIL